MNSIFERLLCVIFLILPLLVWLDQQLTLTPRNIIVEYKSIPILPKLPRSRDELIQYPTAINNYITETFGFRQIFIFGRSLVSGYILRSYPTERIRWGKENWIYQNVSSIKNRYSDDKVAERFKSYQMETEKRKNIAKSFGSEYYLFIAPSKQLIYPEFSNNWFPDRENYQLISVISNKLCEQNSHIICPHATLLDSKKYWEIYFKRDLHWNNLGGFIGANVLAHRLSLSPLINKFSEIELRTVERFRESDLARIAGVLKLYGLEDDFEVKMVDNFEIKKLPDNVNVPENYFLRREFECLRCPTKKVLFFHDSFGISMLKPFTQYASQVTGYETASQSFNLDLIKLEKPNIIIDIIVDAKILNLDIKNQQDGF